MFLEAISHDFLAVSNHCLGIASLEGVHLQFLSLSDKKVCPAYEALGVGQALSYPI